MPRNDTKSEEQKSEKVQECEDIQEIYDDQFEVANPVGKKFLGGFTLFMALWRTITRAKLPDYRIILHGAPPEYEAVVKDCLDQGIEKTGLNAAYTSKFGVLYRKLLFGDAFLTKEIRQGKGFPSRFENASIENVWTDAYGVEMHSATGHYEKDAVAVMIEMSWDEFVVEYPEYEDIATHGTISVDVDEYSKTESISFDEDQKREMEDKKIQLMLFWNKSLEIFVVFAGRDCTIVELQEGSEYPFRDVDRNPMLPVFQFMTFPGTKATYNEGLGSLLYKLHIQMKELMIWQSQQLGIELTQYISCT